MAFDAFLASLASIGGPRQAELYLKLEHLSRVLLKATVVQPSPNLGALERALTAAVYASAASFTLLFFFTLISTLNLALVFRQALLGLLPPLTRGLGFVWGLCFLSPGLIILASRALLALGVFTLNCFVIFINFSAPRVKKSLGALILGLVSRLSSEEPSPAPAPFIIRVAKRAQRRVWPFYTDEFGRSYFRRTAMGGGVALAKASVLSLKLFLRETLGVLGLLLFTAVVLSLPAEPLTRAYVLYSSLVAYSALKVLFKVKPKALRFAQRYRRLRAKVGNFFFLLWFWRRFGGKVIWLRFRRLGRALKAAFLGPVLFVRGVLLKLRRLRSIWLRVKTTLGVGFLWKTEMAFRDDYGNWHKLHEVGKEAYPNIESFGEGYEWWAEEWPEFMDHCRRTAPHKPFPIEKVVYKNLKNFRKGLWSEPLIVWLPYDDWESPVCPITALSVLSELAEDYALYRQIKLTDPYPIGIFGWTPKYMELRFEAKLLEVNNALLAEWDEFQSEFENDFEYEVIHYLISRKIRFQS